MFSGMPPDMVKPALQALVAAGTADALIPEVGDAADLQGGLSGLRLRHRLPQGPHPPGAPRRVGRAREKDQVIALLRQQRPGSRITRVVRRGVSRARVRNSGKPARRQRREAWQPRHARPQSRRPGAASTTRRSRRSRRSRRRHLRHRHTVRPGGGAPVGRAIPRGDGRFREHARHRGAGICAQRDDPRLPRPAAVGGRRQTLGRRRQSISRRAPSGRSPHDSLKQAPPSKPGIRTRRSARISRPRRLRLTTSVWSRSERHPRPDRRAVRRGTAHRRTRSGNRGAPGRGARQPGHIGSRAGSRASLRQDRRGARTPRVAARRRQVSLATGRRAHHPTARRPSRGAARSRAVAGRGRRSRCPAAGRTADSGVRPRGGS